MTSVAKSAVHEIISYLNFCNVSVCWVLKCLPRSKTGKWEGLQHPPHSPDLALSDLYLSGSLKNFYEEKYLRTKMHANQLCNTAHPLERNATIKECSNMSNDAINEEWRHLGCYAAWLL
jgi:hypothetical protein